MEAHAAMWGGGGHSETANGPKLNSVSLHIFDVFQVHCWNLKKKIKLESQWQGKSCCLFTFRQVTLVLYNQVVSRPDYRCRVVWQTERWSRGNTEVRRTTLAHYIRTTAGLSHCLIPVTACYSFRSLEYFTTTRSPTKISSIVQKWLGCVAVLLVQRIFEGCLILGEGMDRLGPTEIIVTTCLSAQEVVMAAVLLSLVFKVPGWHEILLRKVL